MKRAWAYIKPLLAVLVLATLAFAGAGALCETKAKVYASSMRVYSRANSDAKYKIGTLSKGTGFEILKVSGNWAQIEYKGKQGYAKIADLRITDGIKMYVTQSASVYRTAGTSSPICKLSANTCVYMVGWSGSYCLVDNGSGNTGYIAKKYLSKTQVQTQLTAYTNTASAVYRASSGSDKICTLPLNTKVYVTGASGSYYKVKNAVNGSVGYIKKTSLSAAKTDMKAAYTNAAVGVYKGASASSGTLCRLGVNAKVYVIGASGSYYKITNAAGTQVGYVAKGKLSAGKTETAQTLSLKRGTYSSSTSSTNMPSGLKSSTSSASSSSSASARIEAAIYYAQSRLGCYYSSDPDNKNTFDCLTILYYAYKSVGATIPSSAYACGYTGNYKTIASISDLKRGDIVCFDTIDDNDLSDHVGIYLGDSRVLHASSGAGMVVVSTMKSGYYKEHFTCGRRILG